MTPHLASISSIALTQAVKRATCLPTHEGRLALVVVAQYAAVEPDPGESAWVDAPAGDQWGRMLLTVKDEVTGKVIDSFYSYEQKHEVRPTSGGPPCWWVD
jgi:hypothetical protein